jgi:hypothetical protein
VRHMFSLIIIMLPLINSINAIGPAPHQSDGNTCSLWSQTCCAWLVAPCHAPCHAARLAVTCALSD